MSTPFETKGIFVWDADSIEEGDPTKIANKLAGAGFETAYLHVENVDLIKPKIKPTLVAALKGAGIRAVGSAAIYGHQPAREGLIAGQSCVELGLEGFVFDAEGEFESQGHANSNAVKVMQNFRAAAGDLPVGWCYFALLHSPANVHSTFHDADIIRAVMETVGDFHGADYGMPMAYWNPGMAAEDAVTYLTNSVNQWRAFTQKPIIPIGRAYIGNGGKSTPEAVSAFAARAVELGCPGINWWSMYHAVNEVHLPGVWDALTATPKLGAVAA